MEASSLQWLLGMIMAIVSATRAAGHPWPKALAGQGEEGLPQGELRLGSSNSPDISEMWNSEAITQALRTPHVFQPVYSSAAVLGSWRKLGGYNLEQKSAEHHPLRHWALGYHKPNYQAVERQIQLGVSILVDKTTFSRASMGSNRV